MQQRDGGGSGGIASTAARSERGYESQGSGWQSQLAKVEITAIGLAADNRIGGAAAAAAAVK
jgi:hypothetical protein